MKELRGVIYRLYFVLLIFGVTIWLGFDQLTPGMFILGTAFGLTIAYEITVHVARRGPLQ
jgi:hypothetical protein